MKQQSAPHVKRFGLGLGLGLLGMPYHGSFYVSGKLPTYPSPKPTLTLSSYLGKNVGLGEG